MPTDALNDELRRRGAAIDAAAPGSVLHFGDPAREARAAFAGGAVHPARGRALISVQGRERIDFVQRMCTHDVKLVGPQRGVAAVLPTAKGRIVDFVRVFARGEELVLLGSEGHGPALHAWLSKYVVMEELALADRSADEVVLSVLGPGASEAVARVLGHAPAPAATPGSFAVVEGGVDGAPVFALGAGGPPLHAIELIAAADAAGRLFDRLCDAGLAPMGATAFEQVRTELGIPRFGRELTENVNPLEASLLPAISFTKGCYIGQEVVARLSNYSKVQRRLVGARFPATVDPAAVNEVFVDLLRVGHATSATRSPRLDATVALAFVKTEYAKAGTPVHTVAGGEPLHGVLSDLPFS